MCWVQFVKFDFKAVGWEDCNTNLDFPFTTKYNLIKMLKLTLRLIRRRSDWCVREGSFTKIRATCSLPFVTDSKESALKLLEKPSSVYMNFSKSYSKSRDKKKEKKKVVRIDEHELGEYFDVEKLFSDIQKPIDFFKDQLTQHATLRTSAGAIENLKIPFDDKMYTIQDLAGIGRKNPKLIVLDFSSFPEAIPKVIQTFQSSELNINVQQDGTKVFVPIPKVTKEYRESLAKKCKVYFVKCKDSVRDVQMKYIKSLGNIEKLSIEEKSRLTDQLTALGNKQISMAEDILKRKQEELLKSEEAA